ncbi:MAG: kinase [Solobacterium sp.]|nr:kinase [Solobacterium sp.]
MKLLITIRGNSCSGKTSLAKELQKRFGRGTMRLSQDVIRREVLHVKDEPNPKSVPLLKLMLEYGHENAEIVILEGIMKADWYHELFSYAKELYGDHILSWYYDLSFEETQSRRDTKPNRDELTDAKMHLWWTEHDYAPEWNEALLTEEDQISDTADRIEAMVEALKKSEG